MQVSVYVQSIEGDSSGAIIKASNGGKEGPPYVVWRATTHEAQSYHLNDRFIVTIEKNPSQSLRNTDKAFKSDNLASKQ